MLWDRKIVFSLCKLLIFFHFSRKLIVISCFVVVAVINGQLLAQDTDSESAIAPTTTTSTTESPQKIEAKKAEVFYAKLNETLSNQHSLFPRRVDCIMHELRTANVFDTVNQSNYEFKSVDGEFEVTFINKEAISKELEPSIDSAAFSCTIVGYCAIILIVTVMLVVVSCVSCLSRKK